MGGFLQLRTAYNAVANQSLEMLASVEEDRKSVSQMSPWVRQEGSLVKDAGEKIRWWTTCKEEIEQKLVRTEERLKHVTEEERKLQEVVDRNTLKLKDMEKKCKNTSKWMSDLANPKKDDDSDGEDVEVDVEVEGDGDTSMHAKVDVVDKHHHHHQVRVDKDHKGHTFVRVDE